MRQLRVIACVIIVLVSIHAPREGCDDSIWDAPTRVSSFNSRTPGGVRRIVPTSKGSSHLQFQFTHPGRGATAATMARALSTTCFNSRTPGGVRRKFVFEVVRISRVSIHAPREGCDCKPTATSDSSARFQFTHPGRGATRPNLGSRRPPTVSIHAPREGCDHHLPQGLREHKGFNSRTPGGVRPRPRVQFGLPIKVSIHAPREGCDAGSPLGV